MLRAIQIGIVGLGMTPAGSGIAVGNSTTPADRDEPTFLVAMCDRRTACCRCEDNRWQPTVRPAAKAEPDLGELKRQLQDDRPMVRRNAIHAIARMQGAKAERTSALIGMLHDEDRYVRGAALSGLAQMHADPKTALPKMREILDDDDPDMHRTLAHSLAAMGPDAIPTLIELLEDKDRIVRGYAADSLGAIGPAAKEAVPALKRHLTDSRFMDIGRNELVLHRAAHALAKILGDDSYLKDLPRLSRDGL